MINKIKTWWQANHPVLTTQKKIDDLVIGNIHQNEDLLKGTIKCI